MDMAVMDTMDTMARDPLLPSQGMAMAMDMDMVMDMDMAMVDMVIMDTMARGQLMLDMAMVDMDMVMAMDMDTVTVMVMDTMVKQFPTIVEIFKSSVQKK